METMNFAGIKFKINDCTSVPEMVNNLLKQIDPEFFNSREITRERVRIILQEYLPFADSKRVDNCFLFCQYNISDANDTDLRDIIEEYISR